MSPMPASPAKVSALPPMATPRRVTSARPRVMRAERVLSPAPWPSPIPTAIAMIFLSTPPNSQPMTSLLVYTRNRPLLKIDCNSRTMMSSSIAMTLAAACPAMISRARLGPLSTPTGWPGITCVMISVIRMWVSSSRPLVRLITGTQARICCFTSSNTLRKFCEGMPITITSASRTASAILLVARSFSGSVAPGR